MRSLMHFLHEVKVQYDVREIRFWLARWGVLHSHQILLRQQTQLDDTCRQSHAVHLRPLNQISARGSAMKIPSQRFNTIMV